MNTSFRKTFYWSLAGHALVLLGLLLFSLVSRCSRPSPTEPHVFSLVQAPPQPQPKATQAVTPPSSEPETAEEEPPPPEPEPETRPQPKPKSKETKNPEPVKEEVKPEPPPTRSYSEFLKENPIPEPKPEPKPQSPPRPKEDPMKAIRDEIHAMIRNGAEEMQASSDRDLRAMHAYIGRIRARLDRLWNQPSNLPAGEWVARVEFTVSASGKITKVRFLTPSGQKPFDQSVIKAMNRLRRVSPPPDRRVHTFQIPFRMKVN